MTDYMAFGGGGHFPIYGILIDVCRCHVPCTGCWCSCFVNVVHYLLLFSLDLHFAYLSTRNTFYDASRLQSCVTGRKKYKEGTNKNNRIPIKHTVWSLFIFVATNFFFVYTFTYNKRNYFFKNNDCVKCVYQHYCHQHYRNQLHSNPNIFRF